MAVAIALIRGFVRRKTSMLGNFWVDLTRSTLYILLPISLIAALFLVSQGVIQNFSAYKTVPLVQSTSYDKPKLDDKGNAAQGCQGQPGHRERDGQGGHRSRWGRSPPRRRSRSWAPTAAASSTPTRPIPIENPTPLSNFLEILLILLIPGGLTYTFGVMVGNTRQGWALLAVMLLILIVGVRRPALGGGERQSAGGQARRAGHQHGREGNPLRPGRQQPLRRRHHRHLLRRGQHHARLPHPHRRHDAALA